MTAPLLGRPPPPQLVGKGRDPPWRANQWRTRTSETSQWQPGGDREQPMGGRESAWLMPWPRAPTSLLSSGHDAGRGTHNPWPGARGQRLLLPPPPTRPPLRDHPVGSCLASELALIGQRLAANIHIYWMVGLIYVCVSVRVHWGETFCLSELLKGWIIHCLLCVCKRNWGEGVVSKALGGSKFCLLW